MFIFPLTVFLILVSFSEQHTDRKTHYDENGNLIGHEKGTPHGRPLNSRQHEPEYDDGSYEVTESEIQKPCRRSMPKDSGYQQVFVSPYPPLHRRSFIPKHIDLVRKPGNRIQPSQNLPENVPGQVTQQVPEQIREKSAAQVTETDLETKTLEPIRTVLRQGKPLLAHEQIKNDDDRDEIESNKEAANHNEAIPPYADHTHPHQVLNSEKHHPPKDILEPGLDKHHTKEYIPSQVKEYHTKQGIIQDKSLRQGDSSHDVDHDVDTGDSAPIQKENDKFIHSRSGTPNVVNSKSKIQTDNKSPILRNNCKLEDSIDESDDSLPQSRRSMSQGNKQDGKLATTSRAPSKPEQRELLEHEDQNNRQGYSPGLQYIIPTQKPIVISSGNTLLEPTRGFAITPLRDAPLAAMDSSRVCYACSSLSDASCWFPNRGTTVKYCRRGHNACVTKTLTNNGADLIVVRDCSDSCDMTTPVLDTHHVSCSICREDLCNNLLVENGAFSINSFNAMCILILTGIAKYLF